VGESITERGKLFHNLITDGKMTICTSQFFVQSWSSSYLEINLLAEISIRLLIRARVYNLLYILSSKLIFKLVWGFQMVEAYLSIGHTMILYMSHFTCAGQLETLCRKNAVVCLISYLQNMFIP